VIKIKYDITNSIHTYMFSCLIVRIFYTFKIIKFLKLSSNLCPTDPHIDNVCCSAFKTFDLIFKLEKDFHSNMSIKLLFCDLIGPLLE